MKLIDEVLRQVIQVVHIGVHIPHQRHDALGHLGNNQIEQNDQHHKSQEVEPSAPKRPAALQLTVDLALEKLIGVFSR